MILPLETPIKNIKIIKPVYCGRLLKLGVKNLKDLFYHFPSRYQDFSKITRISDLKLNEVATIQGKIVEIKNIRTWKKRMTLTQAYIDDGSGIIKVVWFNQPFLLKTLKENNQISLSGKINFDKGLYFSNPSYEKITENHKLKTKNYSLRHTGRLVPIYPETSGLTSRYLRYLIQVFLPSIAKINDWLPLEIKKSQRLIDLTPALRQIHFPSSLRTIEQAKRRLAFDELFLIQLFALQQKIKWREENSVKIPFNETLIKKFVAQLPFTLTQSQKKAAWEIIQDLDKNQPMNRLLEGDVGSGKTVVAAIAALGTIRAGWQTALMAPTEILAQQHFATIKKLFNQTSIKIGLLTSGATQQNQGGKTTKKELLKKAKEGAIDLIVGTHALIQKEVKFKNLALVIVDEQHRFGVGQRAALARGLIQKDALTNAENTLLCNELTYKIRSCIFSVKNNLGLGHKKSIYQKALEQEFINIGLPYEKEKRINIIYNDKKIGTYQPDFIIDGKIILELKTSPLVGKLEQRQIWTYLKGSNYKLALLVNFSSETADIKRIIYDTARFSRKSASSPRKSAFTPHLLSMTATPIPRTLALTLYGDLDISLLNEMPKNRQEIITRIVPPTNRAKAYDFIRQQVKAGRQVFVICPRIETGDKEQETRNNNQKYLSLVASHLLLEIKAVKEEYAKLSQKIFPDLKIAMLHGKLKTKEKEKIMADFAAKKTDILVSTSVVEVGIDITNAAVMMIEGAERFGLAQLHQFRGRVGRGTHQSYCFLFTESSSRLALARLKAIVSAKSGFELAEYDLRLRGPGEFFGTKQSGLPDLSMASFTDIGFIKEVRQAAIRLLQKDPSLKNYSLIKRQLEQFQATVHLE